MATFAECLAALPTFRNDLLRRQSFELSSGSLVAMSLTVGEEGAARGIAPAAELGAAAGGGPFRASGAYAAYATPLTNVHATGVGIRQKGGEYDPGEHVLKVFVFDKVAGDVQEIPKTDDNGIPVD